MRFFARILSILLVVTFFTSILSSVAFASDDNSFSMPQTNQGVPRDVHTLSQSVILSMISFATCALSGIDITYADHRCLGYDQKTGKLGYVDNSTGIAGMLTSGIALTFNKPMGTSDYLRYLSSNFGLAKHAYAADQTGFAQLSPLLNLWIGMRNLAYILFVLIFIGTGFAIMLRAKIDPRTAMTIENQIPKLIIALLLISFSFAIAGLVVDLMWVLIFVTVNLFVSLDPKGLGSQLGSITNGVSGNPFDLANSVNSVGGFLGIAKQAADGVKDIANTTTKAFFATDVGNVIKWILTFFEGLPILLSCTLGQITQNIPVIGWFSAGSKDFGQCINDGMATIISGFGAVIAFLIFTIALIVVLAKLWWQLIKSYSLFIIYVIFAPLMIMMGVLPGSKINFDNWIRHIAAYLFVFPTAIGILLLGKVVMDAYSTNQGFVPPLLGISPAASQALGPLLGFAIIMLLPQALTIVQDALQAPDLKYLPGVGGALAGGTTAITGLGMQQVRRAFRAKNLVEGIDEGWARKAMPTGLKNLIYGRPIDNKGLEPGGGHGSSNIPGHA